MVFSSAMENQEEILDALNRFEKKPTDDIPPVLEQYLRRVAKTGETLFPWPRVKALFMKKFNQVATRFYQEFPADHVTPSPNVENVEFNEMRQRIGFALEAFSGAPFTIQRLCEMLTEPQMHYKRSDKFLRGVEKNVQVMSTVDPFGNKIVSESRGLVNGLDSPPNGSGEVLPPKPPTFSSFPAPQQTNWPTDSWAGVHPVSGNTAKSPAINISNNDPQTIRSQPDESVQGGEKPADTVQPEKETTHAESPNLSADHTSDSDVTEAVTQDWDSDTTASTSSDVHVVPSAPAGQGEGDGNREPTNTCSENVSSSDESSEKQFREQKEITEVSKSSDSAKEEELSTTTSSEDGKIAESSNNIAHNDHVTNSASCDSHVTESSSGHEEEVKPQEKVGYDKDSEELRQREEGEIVKQVGESESESTDAVDSSVDTNNCSVETKIKDDTSSTNEDVEMTKCSTSSESAEVTTSGEESRTNPADFTQGVESSSEKGQVEEMHVDSENGSNHTTSNVSNTSQSAVSNADVSSTVSSETPMEED